MEPNFQTSFIPKRPVIQERVGVSRPISVLVILPLFILFAVILSAIGLYFYKGVLEKSINEMNQSLETARGRVEPTWVGQIQELDKRLRASKDILSKHIAVSPVFEALEDITLKTVRYTRFSYNLDSVTNPRITVDITGVAVGYRSVALQADLFARNPNIIDPVFSNLVLDERGNVIFDLSFSVNPNFINYKKTLEAAVPPAVPAEPAGGM